MRHCTEVILIRKFCIYRRNIFFFEIHLQLLVVKLGGCAGFDWKKAQVFESHWACLFHRLFIHKCISMKKHSCSLVSKPGEKSNIYQQHHTEFTALGIGRKTRSTKSVLVGELTFATLGEFSGELQTQYLSSASFMRWVISIQWVCLDTYALWINRSPTDSTVSFTSMIKINSKSQDEEISQKDVVTILKQVQWSVWYTCSSHVFPNNPDPNKNKTNCGLNILPVFWYKLIWILFVFMKELKPFQYCHISFSMHLQVSYHVKSVFQSRFC